jgi:hypothetical protein
MAFVTGDTGHTVALVGTHLDEAIIRSVADTRLHPKFGMMLPSSVTAYPWAAFANRCDGDRIATKEAHAAHSGDHRRDLSGTSRSIRHGRASAACRKSQGESHGDLNKFLREASLCPILAA